jgi:molybdate transport system substrate-binding protein
MKARFVAAAVCVLLMTHVAQAAEIRLLAAGAIKEIFLELAPQFESSTGNKVVATWTGSGDIKKRIGAGEAFDLVIVGAPDVDAFIKDGKMAPGSRVDIAGSGVGVAIKAGAPKPDIGSSEAVKKGAAFGQDRRLFIGRKRRLCPAPVRAPRDCSRNEG